ncbi:folic acid synthesis protein [Diplogelasinospora grovesii]|uniref:Folic acid synthesis protein FOL1 n=1 Tax=Diplogelasinospora grovesii TaxID=303347 RepID=A0AAN6S3I7_9PEZI|nr:folic acid synthesis protein [Diplogelasinospora grovesii]
MKGISVSSFSLQLTSQQRILSPLCRHVRAYSRKQLPVNRGNQKLFSLPAARHLSTDSSAPLLPFKKYTLPVKGTAASAASMNGAMNGNHDSPPKKRTAYIALGSNLGDRIAWIEKACNEMDARGIKVKRTSSLWETEPMYVLDQDRFVNGACEVETTLEPLALLDALQDIENSLGRKKIIDKGPRNIDLDILLYENQKVDHPRLKIPHIGIPEREFVLKPLAELIPDKPVDPARPWTLVQDYLNKLPPSSGPALTTLTPLSPNHPPIQALQANRKTHIMAILNVTPDSFSDGGKHFQLDESALVSTVQSFLDAGATMIDIGGQSTAPNAPEISAEEELARVIPAIKLIRSHFPLSPSAPPSNPSEDTPSDGKKQELLISVDTYRASVAEAAVAAGADMVNDVSGGSMDPDMLPTVARLRNTTICLMHMRGTPATMNSLATYPDSEGGLIGSIAKELVQRVRAAEEAGIRRWRIVLDPGLGFAKIGRQNVDVLRHLDELRSWPGLQGLPWLVGSSRKKFIGSVTGVNLPKERIWGTAATVAAAVQGGADVVRVHDVREMAQVALMADAVWRY